MHQEGFCTQAWVMATTPRRAGITLAESPRLARGSDERLQGRTDTCVASCRRRGQAGRRRFRCARPLREQARLADFWLPQRGLFFAGQVRFTNPVSTVDKEPPMNRVR